MFYIYTPDLTLAGVLDSYASMIWIRRYHSPGAFDLTMPFTPICAELAPERLIVSGNEAAIIENVHITQNQNGENEFHASGRFLLSYLDRRILWGVLSKSDTVENVMRHLVTECTTGERAIQGLTVAASTGLPDLVDYLGENKNLLTELNLLAETYGLGHAIDFSTSGIKYRVYTGKDRTISQTENTRAIFSRAFENILSQEYDVSYKAARNVVKADATYNVTIYVPVEGELNTYETVDVEHTATRTIGTATGRDRREAFVNAGDVTKDENDVKLTEAQRNAVIDAVGMGGMVETSLYFTAMASPNRNLQYKIDYDLGDIVTVDSRELGLRVNARITEIKEIYDQNGQRLELTLGYGRPTSTKYVRWLMNG